MKRTVLCLVSLLLLGALAAGAGKPLSKDEVMQLLATGAEPRVIALVHQYGIDFGVDDVVERDVRAAGGGDNLIAALREEASKEAKKHLALGDTFLQVGDLDGAAAQYGQALRFDSKNAGAHIGMGKVREQRGDTDAALAEYQEAIKARPDSGAAYNALGAFWVEKGEQNKALEAYRSGLEAEPENTELKANYARLTAERRTQARAAGATEVNSKDGLTYVWIPAGSFQMGCSPGDSECHSDEKPAHTVTITKGFWMGQTEVTQVAYQRVMGTNPSHFHGERLPVELVTPENASAYCRAVGMRLPTEAEWEYAARAGGTAARYGDLDAIAWYRGNSGNQTHEVAQKQPNAWKLYDMLGNVWEWTNDWYDDHYYNQSPSQDPQGSSSWRRSCSVCDQFRALRGGSWDGNARYSRVSSRGWYWQVVRDSVSGLGNFGFRCAGEVP